MQLLHCNGLWVIFVTRNPVWCSIFELFSNVPLREYLSPIIQEKRDGLTSIQGAEALISVGNEGHSPSHIADPSWSHTLHTAETHTSISMTGLSQPSPVSHALGWGISVLLHFDLFPVTVGREQSKLMPSPKLGGWGFLWQTPGDAVIQKHTLSTALLQEKRSIQTALCRRALIVSVALDLF